MYPQTRFKYSRQDIEPLEEEKEEDEEEEEKVEFKYIPNQNLKPNTMYKYDPKTGKATEYTKEEWERRL